MTSERLRRLAAHAAGSGPEARMAQQKLRRLGRLDLRVAAFLAWGPRSRIELRPSDSTRTEVWQRLGALHRLAVDADGSRIRVEGNPLDLFDAWSAWVPLERPIELLHQLLAVAILKEMPIPEVAAPPSGPVVPVAPDGGEEAAPDGGPLEPDGAPLPSSEGSVEPLIEQLGDDMVELAVLMREGWSTAARHAHAIQWPAPIPPAHRQIEALQVSEEARDQQGGAPFSEEPTFWRMALERWSFIGLLSRSGLRGEVESPWSAPLLDPHRVVQQIANGLHVSLQGSRFQASVRPVDSWSGVLHIEWSRDDERSRFLRLRFRDWHLVSGGASPRSQAVQPPLVVRLSW